MILDLSEQSSQITCTKNEEMVAHLFLFCFSSANSLGKEGFEQTCLLVILADSTFCKPSYVSLIWEGV